MFSNVLRSTMVGGELELLNFYNQRTLIHATSVQPSSIYFFGFFVVPSHYDYGAKI